MSSIHVIRVLLIQQHDLIRGALRTLLDREPNISVVGEGKNNEQIVPLAAHKAPDVILLDIDEPAHAYEVIPALLDAVREAQVIVLSGTPRSEVHQAAIRCGARGLVLKNQAPELLIKAIRKVHAGEVWINRTMMADLLTVLQHPNGTHTDPEEAKIESLTDRERDVIALVGEGLKNQDIGDRLHISESTVRHHLTSVYSKLEVSDRLELLIYAFRHRLVELPERVR